MYAAFWHTALVRHVDFMDNFLAPTETCHTADNFGPMLTGAPFLRRLKKARQNSFGHVAKKRPGCYDVSVQIGVGRKRRPTRLTASRRHFRYREPRNDRNIQSASHVWLCRWRRPGDHNASRSIWSEGVFLKTDILDDRIQLLWRDSTLRKNIFRYRNCRHRIRPPRGHRDQEIVLWTCDQLLSYAALRRWFSSAA